MQGYADIANHLIIGVEGFQQYGPLDWIITSFNILVFTYSFYSIIKTLRGDHDCLTALKWGLIVSIVYALSNSTRRLFTYLDSVPSPALWIVYALPLFLILFFLYLCFSKGIKRRYPVNSRRFYPSGWIWTGLTVCLLALVSYIGYREYKIESYCDRVDTTQLALQPKEVSDGYVVFSSDRNWDTSLDFETPLVNDGSLLLYPTMVSLRDGNGEIYLFSGRNNDPPERTHNKTVYQLINSLFGENEHHKYTEISHRDSTSKDKRIITTDFKVIIEEGTEYFISISSVFDFQSPKLTAFLQINNEFDENQLQELPNSVKFDLRSRQIKKSKDDETGKNCQDSKAQRISKHNDKAVANMFATFFNGSAPRHLVGKMLFEHYERKVANY